MTKQIINYFKETKYFVNLHLAYKHSYSPVPDILDMTDGIYECRHNSEFVFLVLINYYKIFVYANHRLTCWFPWYIARMDYLNGRHQKVTMSMGESFWSEVYYAVTKVGLGSITFYRINFWPQKCSKERYRLMMTNYTILENTKKSTDRILYINCDLDRIANYFFNNCL